jgi:cytochrome c-type biogenesis protein CcmE
MKFKLKNFANLRKTQTIFFLGFALLGLVIVLTTTLPNSFQYYVTVEEFAQKPDQYQNQTIKLAGVVEKGSIVHTKDSAQWDFMVMQAQHQIPVRYVGPMPDTFQDEAEVVVTGLYDAPSGRFVATHILAKCASRYEEKLEAPLEPSRGGA